MLIILTIFIIIVIKNLYYIYLLIYSNNYVFSINFILILIYLNK